MLPSSASRSRRPRSRARTSARKPTRRRCGRPAARRRSRRRRRCARAARRPGRRRCRRPRTSRSSPCRRAREVDPLGAGGEQRSQSRRREARACALPPRRSSAGLRPIRACAGSSRRDRPGNSGAADANAGLALYLRPAEHDRSARWRWWRSPATTERPRVRCAASNRRGRRSRRCCPVEHEVERDRPRAGRRGDGRSPPRRPGGEREAARPLPARGVDADDHDAGPRLLRAAQREARVDRLQLEVATDAGVPGAVPGEQPEQRPRRASPRRGRSSARRRPIPT